jgi:hypothetical protein
VLTNLKIEPAVDIHYVSKEKRTFVDARLGIAWRF